MEAFIFIALLSVIGFIAFLVGLVNPSLVLKWSAKPTRLKVFGYYMLFSLLLVILLAVLAPDTETTKSNAGKDKVVESVSQSKYIEGVTVKSVAKAFGDLYGFEKDEKSSGGDDDYGYSFVYVKQYSSLDFRLDTYCSDDDNKIESIRMTGMVTNYQEKTAEATSMYIMALAALNYEGSDVNKAKQWVADNFNNDKATTVIGGVRFTLCAPSEWVRMLRLEKVK